MPLFICLYLWNATATRGKKFFELSNHLGNVLAVITDHAIGHDGNANGVAEYYRAELVSANDYFPFGLEMAGRICQGVEHRYGFNGQEKALEIGVGFQTAEFWQYNSRLGRRWNLDPVTQDGESPYACFGNNPILFADPDGDQVDPKRTKGKNLMVVANKELRREDRKKHGGGLKGFFNSAYTWDFCKAKICQVFSFGKLKVIEASDTKDAVSKIKDKLGDKGYVENLTIDFHSRFFGNDQYADATGGKTQGMTNMENAMKDLGNGYAGDITTCYVANCWAGGNPDLTDPAVTHTKREDITSSFSQWLDGATVYGPQFATSTIKFFFTNQFSGKFKDSYSIDPGNIKHLGLHTKSVLQKSTTIDVIVKIRNTGKIVITNKKASHESK